MALVFHHRLGKVGQLGAELLADGGFKVTGYDTRVARHGHPFMVEEVDVSLGV